MKRLLLFAVVATLFAACTQDIVVDVTNPTIADNTPETLVVGFEDYETRIQLNEAQKTVWTKGDLVSVFYRSDANQLWQYQGETGARTAELKRVDAGAASRDMDRVVVVYPYNADYYINPSTYNVQASLPAVQTYLEDSYGLDGNIMISSSEYNQFSLKSVCGWLKLQLTGDGEKVKSITLRGNNGEQVAGELYINSADATSILASDSGASDDDSEAGGSLIFEDTILTEVTLDCGEGVELGAEATAFYIALPPQIFEKGLTIEIEDINALKMTKSTDKTIVIERNTIQPMAMFGYEGDFEKSEYCLTAEFEIDENYLNTYVYWLYPTEETNSLVNIDYGDGTFGKNSMHTYPSGGNYVVKYYFERPITEITHSAFTSSAIKSIIIPNEVVKIGYMAFNNSKLASISFEKDSKITTIEQGAFTYCRNLKSISLPNTVTEIGDCVFAGCEKLEEILSHGAKYVNNLFGLLCEHNTSPYKVVACPSGYVKDELVCGGLYTKLSWGAFAYGNIKYVDIWIQDIDQYNFIYDDVLEGVNLTRTTTIANDVLSYCSKLKELSLPIVTSIGSSSFCHNDSLETIEFGSDSLSELTTIANDNVCLHTVHLASGIMSIVDSFNSWAAITEVYCKAVTPPALTNSFNSMVAPTIYVPAESVNGYKTAESWKEFADYIVGYNFETGEVVEGYGIDDSNLDHNKYLTYVANHSYLLDFERENYYYWDTYFEHNVNGIMVAEYKFQLAATQNYTIQYISDDYIYIEGNKLYVYSESYYNHYDERERRYNTIDLTTIGIQPTDLIVLRVDAANNVVTINDQEISFNKIGAAMSSKYIFSAYDSVSDEGHAYYYDGMIDGAKLYYAKGWDSNGYLTYLGCASTDINDKTGNLEACWRAKYYNGKIVETTTFANDRYVEDYVPLGMGNM